MTADQVKKAESEVIRIVQTRKPVYAKLCSLADAKKIKGLRAMFDETYPDPVRVVCVGTSVEELESAPDSNTGMETTVEFCGGTHLHAAHHVGDFCISSEEAIAKGIRRIVALTGNEASRAIKKAQLIETDVLNVKNKLGDTNTDNSKNLSKKITEITEDIAKATLPYWKKEDLRNLLKNMKKTLDEAERAQKAAHANKVLEVVKSLVEERKADKFLVEVLDAGSNTKALDAALKQVKASAPHMAAMFVSVDSDAKKIFCLASCPKEAVSAGLSAIDWIRYITDIMGGKGGGKAESAQASGPNYENASQVLNKARDYASQQLSGPQESTEHGDSAGKGKKSKVSKNSKANIPGGTLNNAASSKVNAASSIVNAASSKVNAASSKVIDTSSEVNAASSKVNAATSKATSGGAKETKKEPVKNETTKVKRTEEDLDIEIIEISETAATEMDVNILFIEISDVKTGTDVNIELKVDSRTLLTRIVQNYYLGHPNSAKTLEPSDYLSNNELSYVYQISNEDLKFRDQKITNASEAKLISCLEQINNVRFNLTLLKELSAGVITDKVLSKLDSVLTSLNSDLSYLDQVLVHKTYLLYECISIVDIYLFVVLARHFILNSQEMVGKYPSLFRLFRTVYKQDYVQDALKL